MLPIQITAATTAQIIALAPVAEHHRDHGYQPLIVTPAQAAELVRVGVIDRAADGLKRSGLAIYRGALACTHGIPLAGHVWGIEILVDDGSTPIVAEDAPPGEVAAPLFAPRLADFAAAAAIDAANDDGEDIDGGDDETAFGEGLDPEDVARGLIKLANEAAERGDDGDALAFLREAREWIGVR